MVLLFGHHSRIWSFIWKARKENKIITLWEIDRFTTWSVLIQNEQIQSISNIYSYTRFQIQTYVHILVMWHKQQQTRISTNKKSIWMCVTSCGSIRPNHVRTMYIHTLNVCVSVLTLVQVRFVEHFIALGQSVVFRKGKY